VEKIGKKSFFFTTKKKFEKKRFGKFFVARQWVLVVSKMVSVWF
jgi:hypothetical protein